MSLLAPLAIPLVVTPNGYFGAKRKPASVTPTKPRSHGGVDFKAPIGAAVLAAGAGTVRFAGWDTPGKGARALQIGEKVPPLGEIPAFSGSAGLFVELDHGSGRFTQYSHLSAIAPNIRQGAKVDAGDPIGAVGKTGTSFSSAHLHFQLRAGGKPLDPMTQIIADAAKDDGWTQVLLMLALLVVALVLWFVVT